MTNPSPCFLCAWKSFLGAFLPSLRLFFNLPAFLSAPLPAVSQAHAGPLPAPLALPFASSSHRCGPAERCVLLRLSSIASPSPSRPRAPPRRHRRDRTQLAAQPFAKGRQGRTESPLPKRRFPAPPGKKKKENPIANPSLRRCPFSRTVLLSQSFPKKINTSDTVPGESSLVRCPTLIKEQKCKL